MILPTGPLRVYVATRPVDFRKGIDGLAALAQEQLRLDPFSGAVFVFRAKRAHLLKILGHDGLGFALYTKRLDHGRFIWPAPQDGVVAISAAQLAYMLDGIDWRQPRRTWRPRAAG